MSIQSATGWGRRGEMEGYLQCIDELRELCDGELPRGIRQFDIRFRLARSIQISFDSTISYTKTESTKKTYRALIELNDLWFAYEGLYALAKTRGLLKASGSKSDPFTEDAADAIGLSHIVKLLECRYQSEMLSEPLRRQDYCAYIVYLRDNASSSTQKGLLERLRDKTDASECLDFSSWLALVYAIRNLYVHNTDTAKSGVKSYATKIAILSISIDFMVGCLLALSERLLSIEISEHH